MLELSRRTVYYMIRDGELASYTLRGRRFVPLCELERLRGALLAPVREPVREPTRARPKKKQLFPRVVR